MCAVCAAQVRTDGSRDCHHPANGSKRRTPGGLFDGHACKCENKRRKYPVYTDLTSVIAIGVRNLLGAKMGTVSRCTTNRINEALKTLPSRILTEPEPRDLRDSQISHTEIARIASATAHR
jgi:hypothetical protein